MSKKAKTAIIIIGALSIISSIYLWTQGQEFNDYFSGIFIGITLIGTAYYYGAKDEPSQDF